MSLKIGYQDTAEVLIPTKRESKDVESAVLDPGAERRVLRKIDVRFPAIQLDTKLTCGQLHIMP
jgi:hypothetical protein